LASQVSVIRYVEKQHNTSPFAKVQGKNNLEAVNVLCYHFIVRTTVEKNYGERTSLFCVVHSRGGATGHKGARRRAAAMQC